MSIIKILGDTKDQTKVIDFCKKNDIAYVIINKTLEDLNLEVVDISKPIIADIHKRAIDKL